MLFNCSRTYRLKARDLARENMQPLAFTGRFQASIAKLLKGPANSPPLQELPRLEPPLKVPLIEDACFPTVVIVRT
eukprot:6484392-Amphidinium_carterae.2